MDWLKVIIMLVLGFGGGFFVPILAQKLILFKEKQKNKAYPAGKRYTSLGCKFLCAAVSAAGLGVCAYWQPSWFQLVIAAAVWILGMVIMLVDMQVRIIANESVLLLLALAGVHRLVQTGLDGLLNSLLAMVVIIAVWMFLGAFLGWWKVGAGDVKLCGAIGFLYGFPDVCMPLLLMAVATVVFCSGGLLLRKVTLKTMFPMAPLLVAGMLLGLPYIFWVQAGNTPLF